MQVNLPTASGFDANTSILLQLCIIDQKLGIIGTIGWSGSQF